MKLTPKAKRFVAVAVRSLPDARERDAWRSWAERPGNDDVPPRVAAIVVRALEPVAQKIEQQVDHGDLDENVQSDLINDLGFIRAILRSLKREPATA